MFAQVHFPESLDPDDLDDYLERGWFRMGQTIFTTNFLNFKNQFYSAIWLRIELERFTVDGTQQKLMKRNATFRVEVRPAELTVEKEALYAKYRQTVSFEPSESLNELLFRRANYVIYDTWEVTIYDSDKLIAIGFFDIGKRSAAGIGSFYDPDYKKYSLGKYLIYLKVHHCKKLKLDYFYPGYFVPGYPFFDYKLTIGKSALYYLQLRSQQWFPVEQFSEENIPLAVMVDKLRTLHQLLGQSEIQSSLLKYEYFDANLVPELKDAELFDFPVFLMCPDIENNPLTPVVVIYDVRNGLYHLIKNVSVWASNTQNNTAETYTSHLLAVEQVFFSTETPEEMTAMLFIKIRS